MAFTKYQSIEKVEVLTPKQHKTMESELHKIGKSSVEQLNPDQRKQVTQKVAKA